MQSLFYNKKSTCGCNAEESPTPKTTPFCYVLDLEEVYNNLNCFGDDSPCEACSNEDDTLNSEFPHGSVGGITTACSKLAVFKNARILNGDFVYEEVKVYHSRGRRSLPRVQCDNKGKLEVLNPIECPAENGLRNIECCRTCTDGVTTVTSCDNYAGPYIYTNYTEVPATGFGDVTCTGCGYILITREDEWRSLEFGHSFTPCILNNPYIRKGSKCSTSTTLQLEEEGFILSGYALDSNQQTWLINENEEPFASIKNEIIDNDPLGAFHHTVYVHFELKTSYIRCCGPQTGSPPRKHFSDQDTREKYVVVLAAIGFSCGLCGFDPEAACTELYKDLS